MKCLFFASVRDCWEAHSCLCLNSVNMILDFGYNYLHRKCSLRVFFYYMNSKSEIKCISFSEIWFVVSFFVHIWAAFSSCNATLRFLWSILHSFCNLFQLVCKSGGRNVVFFEVDIFPRSQSLGTNYWPDK